VKTCKIILFLLSLSILIFTGSVVEAVQANDTAVRNLQVKDVPYDDGGGLTITWSPLPKEKKIIEYRVYRGISPDSLFYIGKIPVNEETGFSGDTVRYVNQGYILFVSATSPGKLKHEKGQGKGTIGAKVLYRKFPRNMEIYGPYLDDFRILSVIHTEDYLLHSKKREFVEKDTLESGKIDTTSTILAGLKLDQFKYILTKLKPGKEYYYAVEAMNYTRNFSPLSEIASGTSVDNPPEKLTKFVAVDYRDTKNMKFEWSLPTFKTDIASFNIYLVDANGRRHKIFSRGTAYPYTNMINANVSYEKIKEAFEKFNPANVEWYKFNISLIDRAEQETFAKDEPVSAEITNSSVLPHPPKYFTVTDNPSDKGDKNLVYFGKPYINISKMNYNDDCTELEINYMIQQNELFEINNITFNVNGTERTDYVLNNKTEIDVDPNNLPNSLTITMECKDNDRGIELPEDYSIKYDFRYDKKLRTVKIDTS